MDAFARLPSPAFFAIGAILAQKLALRPASSLVRGLGAGGLSLEPVARLYLARPLAVSPAPLLTGSFSPRPTARETLFLAMLCAVDDGKVQHNGFGQRTTRNVAQDKSASTRSVTRNPAVVGFV